MNYVDVPKRGWRISQPMVDRDKEWLDAVDGSDCEEEGFEKE